MVEAGIVLDPSLAGINEIGPFMLKIPIREATSEEILQVHSEDHLKFIQSTEDMSRDQLLKETETGDSIYVNNDSICQRNYPVVVLLKHVKQLLRESKIL